MFWKHLKFDEKHHHVVTLSVSCRLHVCLLSASCQLLVACNQQWLVMIGHLLVRVAECISAQSLFGKKHSSFIVDNNSERWDGHALHCQPQSHLANTCCIETFHKKVKNGKILPIFAYSDCLGECPSFCCCWQVCQESCLFVTYLARRTKRRFGSAASSFHTKHRDIWRNDSSSSCSFVFVDSLSSAKAYCTTWRDTI